MKDRFEIVRAVADRLRAGWRDGAAPKVKTTERFTMKPGEVTILRGGGAEISRQPHETSD